MTCQEIKNNLDWLCSTGHADNEVIILLSEKGIGIHPNSRIQSVTAGFDWEHGKVLISPEKRLVSDVMSRDCPKNRIKWKDIIHCPTCEHRVNQKSNYCPFCGQRFATEIICRN